MRITDKSFGASGFYRLYAGELPFVTSFFPPGLQRGTSAEVSVKGYNLWATAPMGAGEFRAAVGQRKSGGVTNIQYFGLGYHYNMSKRTTLYAGYTRIGNGSGGTVTVKGDYVPLAGENANLYAVGVSHNF